MRNLICSTEMESEYPDRIKKTILATVIAPLSVMLVWTAMCVQAVLRDSVWELHEAVLLFVVAGGGFLAVAYTFTLLVGVPIHLVLNRLKIHSSWAYIGAGLLSTAVYQFVISNWLEMPAQLQEVGYLIYMSCGAVVSYVFWFIAVRSHNEWV